MIWPVLARYLIAVTAGVVWARGFTLAAVLAGVIVVLLICHDVRQELQRGRLR